MTDQNQSLEFKLERDIANLLISKLEHYELSLERASQIARFILAHLPDNLTDEQVRQILPSLDDEFVELADIVYKHIKSYEETDKESTLKNARDLIKHQHFEQASSLAQEYFNRKYIPKQ